MDHLREPVTLTPIDKCLVLELSLLIFSTYVCFRLGFEHPTSHLRVNGLTDCVSITALLKEIHINLRRTFTQFTNPSIHISSLWLSVLFFFILGKYHVDIHNGVLVDFPYLEVTTSNQFDG